MRVARAGPASPDVELGGAPAVPGARQLADQPGVARHQPLPEPQAGVMAADVEVQADQLHVGHGEDPAAHLGEVLVRDAGLVDLHAEVDRDAELGEVGAPPEVRHRRLAAQPDLGDRALLLGDLLDQVDLVDVLDGDPDPGGHADPQVLLGLAAAVDRHPLVVHAGRQHPGELLG